MMCCVVLLGECWMAFAGYCVLFGWDMINGGMEWLEMDSGLGWMENGFISRVDGVVSVVRRLCVTRGGRP